MEENNNIVLWKIYNGQSKIYLVAKNTKTAFIFANPTWQITTRVATVTSKDRPVDYLAQDAKLNLVILYTHFLSTL